VRFSKEVKVGLFAIVTIAIFYSGVNYLKGIDFFSSINRYYVVYEDVGGLQVSNPVKINGYNVGRVSAIDLLQNQRNNIIVEIEIEDDILLGDTTVALLDVEFLGTVTIILEVGDLSNPLSSGDTLRGKLDQGLEDLLRTSALPVADNLQITIRRINTFLEGLYGKLENLDPALGNISDAANNIKKITGAENRIEINNLLKNLNGTVNELHTTLSKVNPVLENFNHVADSLKALNINETLGKMNSALDNLNATLTQIKEGDGSFSKLINEDSLYVQLNSTLLDLDKLLIHINETPKDFFSPLGRSSKKIQKRLEKEK